MPASSHTLIFPRQAWCSCLALALTAACASNPIAVSDGAGTPGDGQPIPPAGRDARLSPGDTSPLPRGDGPTLSATGDLPFGWKAGVPVGPPGWRNTPTSLCDVQQGWGLGGTAGLWADSRGVFVLGWKYCGYGDRILAGCPNDGTGEDSDILVFNDGSGWRTIFDGTITMAANKTFSGVPLGPLVLSGTDCGVSLLDSGTGAETCWLEDPWSFEGTKVFVANPAVAYAVSNDRFLDFRAGAWTERLGKVPEKFHAVWGTEDVAYLAGDYRLYVWANTNPSTVVPLPNAPAAHYTAAWGFAEDDVWFGTSFGQLVHYDGTQFAMYQASAPERDGIVGLWGQSGQLYFRTATEFGRVVDGAPETLLSVPAPPALYGSSLIVGMWGISPTEVFVALRAASADDLSPPCRMNSVFWFDGQGLHQF